MKVRFAESADLVAKEHCRVCGARKSRHVLTVESDEIPSVKAGSDELQLFKCEDCESLFYDGTDPAHSFDIVQENVGYWLDYVQAGAGISSMLAPLFALEPIPQGNLLDVGCGFGFVVDFWTRRHFEAVGLEPSPFGDIGRKKLGVDVRHQTIDDFLIENPDRAFETVFSSEVIEHTPSPREFVRALAAVTAEGGVIILTTPSTATIDPSIGQATLIAALSPGFHYALISPKAIKHLFEACGLRCHIAQLGFQTICWASRHAVPTVNTCKFDWEQYYDYLSAVQENPDPHVSTGAMARLFKDALNNGEPQRAGAAFEKLSHAALLHYRIDLRRPEINDLSACRKPLSLLDQFPSWLGSTLLFGALYVGQYQNDRRAKLRMLDAALVIFRRRLECEQQFAQEAAHFMPFAERQYIIALSEALTTTILAENGPPKADLRATLSSLLPVAARYLRTQ